MSISSRQIVVLTGAGFTKNVGGLLGDELWSRLFSDRSIQLSDELKQLLSENFDFEDVYTKVMRGIEFEENNKDKIEGLRSAMQDATRAVYKKLDDSIIAWNRNDIDKRANFKHSLDEIIKPSEDNDGSKTQLIFTLNQDLFLERYYQMWPPCSHRLDLREHDKFQDNYYKEIRKDVTIYELYRDINLNRSADQYIKLHGSFGWLSSDGKDQIVITKNKKEFIDNEPLLKCYFNLFRETLTSPNKKLIVVGYSFKDKHINKVITEGFKKGLKLYVIDITSPRNLKKAMPSNMWSCVAGYFPYKLTEVGEHQRREIRNSLGLK